MTSPQAKHTTAGLADPDILARFFFSLHVQGRSWLRCTALISGVVYTVRFAIEFRIYTRAYTGTYVRGACARALFKLHPPLRNQHESAHSYPTSD